MDSPVELLKQLIATPSVSRDESATASIILRHLEMRGVSTRRLYNNVWAVQSHHDPAKPTLLLNSHHDTIKPSPSYTRPPFVPEISDGRLYGLGSNDAGASAVSLIDLFCEHYSSPLPFNLVLAITAEEECMGEHGMRAFLPHLIECGIKPDMAIVGEPTGMQPAIAERGLVVLDCVSRGVRGHAARSEGVNAIYKAMADIDTLHRYRFERCSPVLGPVTMQVTMIEAGTQHNVVPDECRWVADVRTTDAYTNTETAAILQNAVSEFTTLTPRSTRLNASVISSGHPLARAATAMGLKPFVSPTLSDRALMHGIPALKIGPGDSARSHTANEYVFLSDITQGIDTYSTLLLKLSETIRKQ